MSLTAPLGTFSADLAIRADDELLRITERTLASRVEAGKLVRVRVDGGVAADGELRNAESLLAAARAIIAALRRQRAQDLNALVLLLGQGLPPDLPAAQALAQAALPAVARSRDRRGAVRKSRANRLPRSGRRLGRPRHTG